MTKLRFTLQAAALVVFTLAFTSFAQAQASRTWVSGVGDDVNPCSRTAPCKTWAGAISKTAAGGEIDALDPGGFGTLTITKSITIDGTTGQGFGSTLNTGAAIAGFTINDSLAAAPRTSNVILRNLSIQGGGTATLGSSGIRFLSGKSLHVEDVFIQNQQTHGIELNNNIAAHELFVNRVTISRVGVVTAGGSGIRITGAAPSPHLVTITNSQIFKAQNGVFSDVSSRITIANSTISHMTADGVIGGNNTDINVKTCVITHSANGVETQGTGVMRLSDNIISQNNVNVRQTGGTMNTYGTNQLRGNTGGGDTVGTLTLLAPANQ